MFKLVNDFIISKQVSSKMKDDMQGEVDQNNMTIYFARHFQYAGNVTKGSIVAILQSIGATGQLGGLICFCVITAGFFIGFYLYKNI